MVVPGQEHMFKACMDGRARRSNSMNQRGPEIPLEQQYVLLLLEVIATARGVLTFLHRLRHTRNNSTSPDSISSNLLDPL